MNLNEIKEALSKATPGPWVNGPGCIYVPSEIPSKRKVIGVINKTDNAELVANTPQWLASLVSQVEEMQKTLEWYADEQNHVVQYGSFNAMLPPKVMEDKGERARQTLQSLKEDKP